MRQPSGLDCEVGPDVDIQADEIEMGPGCRIGFSGQDDFRTPPGVRIRARRLVLGAGVEIGRSVRIDGGEIFLGDGVRVKRHATINASERLEIGSRGTVGEGCEVAGRQITIGQELWMLPGAKIGGGSAFERSSSLDAGHYLHLGVQTLVNTARPVTIGHEVGLGTRTSIYTHGAYPSRLMGFPVAFQGVQIGDFSWVPGATVNPGVKIGRNCVIGVNSLVTADVPDGALAAGSPARVIKEDAYPRPLTGEPLRDFYAAFLADYATLLGSDAEPRVDVGGVALEVEGSQYRASVEGAPPSAGSGRSIVIGADLGLPGAGATHFDTSSRRIAGIADVASERLANELRRYGIRFYSRPQGDAYADWADEVPAFLPS